MKVRHTLICFFFLSALQDGNNGLVKAKIYTRTEGEDVTVLCSSSFSGSRKILCKEPCEQEDIVIDTTDDTDQNGRYSIEWRTIRGEVYVTITQLNKSDSGLYRCGSGSSYKQFEIIVVDALLSGDSSEEKTLYSRTGGNILVGCVFTTSGTRKYFCKGECEEKDILVETTGLTAQRDRYSIRYLIGSSSGGFVYVGITQLTRNDSGRYRCGLDKPLSRDPYRGFKIVVTDAPTTSKPNQAMTSSVPSASTATTTQSSSPPTRGVWLYAVIVVVIAIVIVSGLVLMIFCIRRNINPDGLNTRRTSEGTNTEIALYENCGPVSTCEDSTYQSLDPASRDQDQTYSTLTHT